MPCLKKDNHHNGPIVTDDERGEQVCSSCGLVLNEKLQSQASSTGITGDSHNRPYYIQPNYTEAPNSTFGDMGLSSVISNKNTDAYGNAMSPHMRNVFYRLRTWDKRSHFKGDRLSLRKGLITIKTLGDKLVVSQETTGYAAKTFRKIKARQSTKGLKTDVLATACFYAACRAYGIPRSMEEISKISNVPRKIVFKCYSSMTDQFGHRPAEENRYVQYVTKLKNSLVISSSVANLAVSFIKKGMEKRYLIGKSPLSVSAAAVYLACIVGSTKTQVSQQKLADEIGVSAVSIRNNYLIMANNLEISDQTTNPKNKKP